MSLGGAEQHPIGDDDRPPAPHLQHPQEEGQEQQLRLLGLAQLQQVSGYDVRVQTPLEGRIGQDQGVLLPVRVLVAEAVPVFDEGVVDAVGHHVHGPDAQHGTVHVEAVEHVVHVVVLLRRMEEDVLLVVCLQVLPGGHQETSGAAGGVYKDVIFDTSRSPEKCIKIAKTAGNKAFLAVFAILVVVQLAPLRCSRSAADAGIWAPVRLAQGKIKRFGQIKKYNYARKIFIRALNNTSTSSSVLDLPREIRTVPLA